MIRNSNRQTPI